MGSLEALKKYDQIHTSGKILSMAVETEELERVARLDTVVGSALEQRRPGLVRCHGNR